MVIGHDVIALAKISKMIDFLNILLAGIAVKDARPLFESRGSLSVEVISTGVAFSSLTAKI